MSLIANNGEVFWAECLCNSSSHGLNQRVCLCSFAQNKKMALLMWMWIPFKVQMHYHMPAQQRILPLVLLHLPSSDDDTVLSQIPQPSGHS
jgi:hypothetical protein